MVKLSIHFRSFVLVFISLQFLGCSPIEITKTIWGSSTRKLEQARSQAITKTYDKSYWNTMRAAIAVMEKEEWVLFKKDEVSGYVVLMGIKGAVNTTEVGVFLVEVTPNQTRIEISSLSTSAKRLVAKPLFHQLDIAFGLIPPDPVEDVKPDPQAAP